MSKVEKPLGLFTPIALAYKEPGNHHPTSFQILTLFGKDRIVVNSGIGDFRDHIRKIAITPVFADETLPNNMFSPGSRESCRPITAEEQHFILGKSNSIN
jgi:hypothetical protein